MKEEFDKWDNTMSVVCIKEYETLKVNGHYQIKGRGNLEFNADPNVKGKKGYGFCIEDNGNNWLYFTLKEMSEYFMTQEEHYKIYLRDNKINKILND